MEQSPEQIQFPDLATEINQMTEADQDMREQNLEDGSWDVELDRRNTERMKEIVAQIEGGPAVKNAGEDVENQGV